MLDRAQENAGRRFLLAKVKKENNMKRVFLVVLVAFFLSISILGCNAMRGVGTDLRDTGKHIENIGK